MCITLPTTLKICCRTISRNCGFRITSLQITAVFMNMVFSDEDKILTKNLYQLKGYNVVELVDEFTNKWWTKSSINRLLKNLKTLSTDSQAADQRQTTKCPH